MAEIVDNIFKSVDSKVDELLEMHPIEEGNQLEELSSLY